MCTGISPHTPARGLNYSWARGNNGVRRTWTLPGQGGRSTWAGAESRCGGRAGSSGRQAPLPSCGLQRTERWAPPSMVQMQDLQSSTSVKCGVPAGHRTRSAARGKALPIRVPERKAAGSGDLSLRVKSRHAGSLLCLQWGSCGVGRRRAGQRCQRAGGGRAAAQPTGEEAL